MFVVACMKRYDMWGLRVALARLVRFPHTFSDNQFQLIHGVSIDYKNLE